MDDFSLLDATAQAGLVRSRQLRPIELVEAAIARIQALNPSLNAVVTPLCEQAREAAGAVDIQAPFAGVPFLLKDLGADFAGVPTTRGSVYFRDFVPERDTELVRRYRNAGLIVLGKTNTSELGLAPTTEPLLFGPTRNPWDLSRSAGGSSGGSAAAVAAGLVAVAHGNDGGGSLRIPASCCGVFALKPSRGRMPLWPSLNLFLPVNHVFSRSVRDSAALLDATAGSLPGDPFALPPPPRPFREEVHTPPGRLRIAFSTRTLVGTPLHADCVAAVREAALLCRDLGHEVIEAAPEVDGEQFMEAFLTIWAAQLASNLEQAAALLGRQPAASDLEPATVRLHEYGKGIEATRYLGALEALTSITDVTTRFFQRYDIWLCSTLGSPPPPLGTLMAPGDVREVSRRFFAFAPNTALFNVNGQPAMSVPLAWGQDGLPIGCQFVARQGQDALLFRLAGQLEEARPWGRRWPSIALGAADNFS